MCERWKDFQNFYDDMGKRPGPNYELDRINNDEGYNPENCRWLTKDENLRKRNCIYKTIINGEEMTLVEIAQKFNLSPQSVYIRWRKGDRNERLIRPQDNRGRPRNKGRIVFNGLTLIKDAKMYRTERYYVLI